MEEFVKYVLYSIVGAIIFLLIYSIWFSPTTPNFLQSLNSKAKAVTSGSINLETFSRNPENYLDKNITITGKYESYFRQTNDCRNVGTLSNNGFEVMFCPSVERNFEQSNIYTIKGIVKKDINKLTKKEVFMVFEN